MMKTAIVTGAGSGIGYYAAKTLFENGWKVYDFSRTNRCFEGVNHIACDVAKEEDVLNAVRSVIEKEGQIDLLINNAGFGISGAVEFTDPEDSHRLMEVNLFGADRLTRACVGHMRKRGQGRIVFISSVAAVFPIPFQAWYSVSKAAVNAYASTLRNEVAPFGITVTAVMPGDTKTGFIGSRIKTHQGDECYGGKIERSVSKMEKDEKNGMSAEKAGAWIARVGMKKRVRPLYTIGFGYRALVFLKRILPESLIGFLIRMLYAK